MSEQTLSLVERLRIFHVRGQAVVLDSGLAAVYGVRTGTFNQAIKRNLTRFPGDFSFRPTEEEFGALMFQFGRSKGRGGRRKLPRVFMEHGAIMAATVLNSPRDPASAPAAARSAKAADWISPGQPVIARKLNAKPIWKRSSALWAANGRVRSVSV